MRELELRRCAAQEDEPDVRSNSQVEDRPALLSIEIFGTRRERTLSGAGPSDGTAALENTATR
jgi:hypothetical protein